MKIAIVGYGRLGKGICEVISEFSKVELYGVFSRRNVSLNLPDEIKVFPLSELFSDIHLGQIDCVINATSSKTDAERITPVIAEHYCVVDSFDVHGRINLHRKNTEQVSQRAQTSALVSCGWDPGLFSIIRNLSSAFMPKGRINTFWGKGMSQGHSQAIREIKGVIDAIQYTIPDKNAKKSARCAERELSDTERVKRMCYVAAKRADRQHIKKEIAQMESYFKGYKTSVKFIGEKRLKRMQKNLSHKGEIICSDGGEERFDFLLFGQSNPRLTARILLACAIAASRLKSEGKYGAYTMLDVPPKYYLSEEKYKYL